MPLSIQKAITTAAGLGCIPFIVHPIDNGVDWLMDSTLRKYVFDENDSEKTLPQEHQKDQEIAAVDAKKSK